MTSPLARPQLLPVPDTVRPWVRAAVAIDTTAGLAGSGFPALSTSMMVLRREGQVFVNEREGVLLPPAALIGPSTQPRWFAHLGAVRAMGLVLEPPTLRGLFGGDLHAAADGFWAWSALPGDWGELAERLRLIADDTACLDLWCQQLHTHMTVPEVAAQHARLVEVHSAVTRQGLAGHVHLGISARQLQRVCRSGFGLRPAQLHQLERFQSTLGHALKQPASVDGQGASLAAERGFADQSHLGRQVRQWAGATLGDLMKRGSQGDRSDWPLAIARQFEEPVVGTTDRAAVLGTSPQRSTATQSPKGV